MTVEEAVDRAKDYASRLFAREGLVDARLEEVEHDQINGFWNVTVGLLRPTKGGAIGALSDQLAAIRGEAVPGARIYKVVRLKDADGEVVSVKIREEAA